MVKLFLTPRNEILIFNFFKICILPRSHRLSTPFKDLSSIRRLGGWLFFGAKRVPKE